MIPCCINFLNVRTSQVAKIVPQQFKDPRSLQQQLKFYVNCFLRGTRVNFQCHGVQCSDFWDSSQVRHCGLGPWFLPGPPALHGSIKPVRGGARHRWKSGARKATGGDGNFLLMSVPARYSRGTASVSSRTPLERGSKALRGPEDTIMLYSSFYYLFLNSNQSLVLFLHNTQFCCRFNGF